MSQSISAPNRPERLIALDGLRGIAALVVVVHHVYQLARPYLEPARNAWAPGSGWWWLSATPLKLTTAGSEAVLVFFVLSGLVLPLPLLRGRPFSWSAFFASRLVRLLLPAWAAVVFAIVLVWLLPRPASAAASGSWLDATVATGLSGQDIAHAVLLLPGTITLDSALWSLRWELAFSAALPVFIGIALAAHRTVWAWAVALGCFAAILLGKEAHVETLRYLPVFLLGVVIAVHLDEIRAWAARHPSRIGRAVLLCGSLLAIVASWMARPIWPAGTLVSDAIGTLTPFGGVGLVVCAVAVPGVRGVLERRLPQRLGRISFSLYLVHLPILGTVAYLLGDRRWWAVGLITVPLALLAAAAFCRWVEQPAHTLAGRLGRAVRRATGRVSARALSSPGR